LANADVMECMPSLKPLNRTWFNVLNCCSVRLTELSTLPIDALAVVLAVRVELENWLTLSAMRLHIGLSLSTPEKIALILKLRAIYFFGFSAL
jgi:hypothetical protein